jgi:hypothetical protein
VTGDPRAVILRAAADLLDQRGWVPVASSAQLAAGPLDLPAALTLAATRHGDTDPYAAQAQAYACWALLRAAVGAPITWNDTPGRTPGEVTTLLRDTADTVPATGPAAAPDRGRAANPRMADVPAPQPHHGSTP